MSKTTPLLIPPLRCLTVSFVCVFLGLLLPVYKTSAQVKDQNTSSIRVIHASPYVGTADVFVDGQSLLSAFQFATVTGYVPVPAGVHNVQIALLGKGIHAALITEKLAILTGVAYTVAAIGTNSGNLGLRVFEDNNQVVADHARVRVYNLAADTGAVNMNVGNEDTLNAISYTYASEYLTVDSGPCAFVMTDPAYHSTVPLSTNLVANTVTSIFAVGLLNGSPQIQLISAQAQGMPGLPNTGSDPVQADTTQMLPSWLFAMIMITLIGGGIVYCCKRGRRRQSAQEET